MNDGHCLNLPPQALPDRPVAWNSAFARRNCTQNCRSTRTDAELGATARANAAARLVTDNPAA